MISFSRFIMLAIGGLLLLAVGFGAYLLLLRLLRARRLLTERQVRSALPMKGPQAVIWLHGSVSEPLSRLLLVTLWTAVWILAAAWLAHYIMPLMSRNLQALVWTILLVLMFLSFWLVLSWFIRWQMRRRYQDLIGTESDLRLTTRYLFDKNPAHLNVSLEIAAYPYLVIVNGRVWGARFAADDRTPGRDGDRIQIVDVLDEEGLVVRRL